MRSMRSLVSGCLLLMLSGCLAHSGRSDRDLVAFGPAILTSSAPTHFHSPGCGHRARWHGNRWVYASGGGWEYTEYGRTYTLRTIRSTASHHRHASLHRHTARTHPSKAHQRQHSTQRPHRSRGHR